MGDTRFNERAWLAWLVKVRVIIISFLLAVELLIVNLTPNNVNTRLFITFILVWYTISVFFIVLHSLWQEFKLQAIVQIFADLVFATAVVYATGGIDTFFNFLYPLVIIVAAILLPRYWAYLTAAVAFILFGAVVELCYFDRLPTFQFSPRGDLKSLQVVVHSIHSGLITTDLDGRITLLNSPGQKLLERTASSVYGMHISDLFLDRPPNLDSLSAQCEVRGLTPGGKEK